MNAPSLDSVLEVAVSHLPEPLNKPETVKLVMSAVQIAYDAFLQDTVTDETALAAAEAAVGLGIASLPSGWDAAVVSGVRAVLLAAVGWLWKELKPQMVSIEDDGATIVVEVTE